MADLTESRSLILQQSILHVIDQSMYPQFLAHPPRLLHNGDPSHVVHLLLHIELAQQIFALLRREAFQILAVPRSYVADTGQPCFQRTVVMLLEGCSDASAAVVAGYDNVLYLQHLY